MGSKTADRTGRHLRTEQIMAEKRSKFRPNLDIFGVPRLDPGWIYIVKNGDLLKVGKTNDPKRRLREARTWLPDLEVVGIKPFWNISRLERTFHEGCAQFWQAGEWFRVWDQNDYQLLAEGFTAFYDEDRDMNSVNFIYWWNGSGFAELSIERDRQNMSLTRWKRCRASP